MRRTVKFFGLYGGKRRRRQDPIAWVLLSLAAIVIALKIALLTVLHVAAAKGVSR